MTAGFGMSPDPDEDFEPGPRLLLVQPGIPQERKKELNNDGAGMIELLNLQTALTLAGVAREAEAGTPVDLVCWGESMLPGLFMHPRLVSAQLGGSPPLWWPVWDLPKPSAQEFVDQWARSGEQLIGDLRRGLFYGALNPEALALLEGVDLPVARSLLGEAGFVAGGILYTEEMGAVRRTNAAMLWGPDGKWGGAGWKRHLVPGAETLHGLEKWAWARNAAHLLMPYTPDFRGASETGILRLTGARGSWKIGASICFDNGYEDVFLEGAVLGGADFNLVLSNEAWYEDSQEFDQMVAMAALWAASSGRAIARATNSGISVVLGPGGRELGRLRVGDQDRAVTVASALTVPVPRNSEHPPQTIYGHTFPLWNALWMLAPLILLGLAELFGGRPLANSSVPGKSS
jgi:predicted amidohydrolase